ncbi:MAG: ATP-dependent DNA helicase RecQ [Planctomycetes bacterium]|nr:ATP-dependent DNA helicase RecQ [Planctomycetota bacterium]
MSNRLETYLKAALARLEAWGGERLDLTWNWLKHALPPSERARSDAAEKLPVALDVVGIRCLIEGGRAAVWPCYMRTAIFDQASILARAFRAGTFGPSEVVGEETLSAVARCATGPGGRRASAMRDALVRAGFSVRSRSGREATVELRLTANGELRLARERRFVVSRPVARDALLGRHFAQFKHYRSAAQRDVIQELLNDAGANMIVARMPTGGGKSLTFLIPAIEWRRRNEAATAVVISPVIALMNDQMRKIEKEYGDTGLAAAEINSTVPVTERTQIYRRFRSGRIDVLFLSPEKAAEPFFRETLLQSAEHVRLLVIDEAHMVPEWGQDFRTDFFRLGEIRRRLIERGARLKTLFLSATLTEDNERRLLDVFGESDGIARFEEPALRRELSIRVVTCKKHDEKLEALLPLVEQVEKPCIIYCGLKKHVTEIQEALRERGLRRSFNYTGNTAPEHRRERLNAFHEGDADVVVATNAFGLGVDKQDVRTVIHFDVPQNLDSYYQEIGRCSRDGRTGHAFLLYTPGSMGHAVKSQLALLGSEKAAARATALLEGRFDLPADGEGACLLPLHALPDHIENDSSLNQSWNAATLNLLDQVGDVQVGLRVLRHVHVTRSDAGAGARAKKDPDDALGLELIEDQMGRKSAGPIDLAKAAKKAKVRFLDAEAAVVRVALRRAIEVTTLDEDRGEAWVYGRRKGVCTWSSQHAQRLEQFRAEQLAEATRGIGELRGFVKARGCRLTPFARLYRIEFNGNCGHCDHCDPRLVLR